MSVINVLGVTLAGQEYHQEFLQMIDECLKINREDTECVYIDAFAGPSDANHFMVVSMWTNEDALMKWYRSPFHIDLRKKGMQGMLKSYFSHLGELLPGKSHQWSRPEA
ncbi:MAG: antibiotic biosynthesis monooxygenase [Candidatus Obscuribacterales bacterium]|nr:antibiotic biosynthesis monooxygenase [Candidatus Obscuribacterales bacterium]